MIVGKKYRMSSNKTDLLRPELQAVGKIVECVKDWHNGFYTITDGKEYWLIDSDSKYYENK